MALIIDPLMTIGFVVLHAVLVTHCPMHLITEATPTGFVLAVDRLLRPISTQYVGRIGGAIFAPGLLLSAKVIYALAGKVVGGAGAGDGKGDGLFGPV